MKMLSPAEQRAAATKAKDDIAKIDREIERHSKAIRGAEKAIGILAARRRNLENALFHLEVTK